ncbi:MAG: PLP-dependent enzyme glutamate decarboxylase [Bryobacterales bacterium]|nr:PLP-dependent enzyme glutamate decarboxylase [Bryobacterales bacterium]
MKSRMIHTTGIEMELETLSIRLLRDAVSELQHGFARLPPLEAEAPDSARFASILGETARRMQNNLPYFHPLYAGQMLKPPHPVARAAYAMATWINPNNHALDGGRASSEMEKEAVAEIAAMFGWQTHLGHLTGGGTMANLEALWMAGQLYPGKAILASSQSHYTHERISAVLKLPFDKVAADSSGRMDVTALESRLQRGDVGCVVATLGTTGFGAVDPLPEILRLRDQYGFRVHADCAYGGYFTLADNLNAPARAAYDALPQVDSIVVDPHKHGLQPYGCGCILFRDPSLGTHYRHDSPFTYFSSAELHLGEISLECSRPGASAVALWATQRLLPLVRGGEFADSLSTCRRAALAMAEHVRANRKFILTVQPELDIVVWAVRAESASEASSLAQRVFDEAAKNDLHLALIRVPAELLPELTPDQPTVLCLRSVLMKPEHEAWLPEILDRLSKAVEAAEKPLQ